MILQDQRQMIVRRLVHTCYYLLMLVIIIVFWAVVVNHKKRHRTSSTSDVSSSSVDEYWLVIAMTVWVVEVRDCFWRAVSFLLVIIVHSTIIWPAFFSGISRFILVSQNRSVGNNWIRFPTVVQPVMSRHWREIKALTPARKKHPLTSSFPDQSADPSGRYTLLPSWQLTDASMQDC